MPIIPTHYHPPFLSLKKKRKEKIRVTLESPCELGISIPVLQMGKRTVRLNNLPKPYSLQVAELGFELRFVEPI